TRSRSVAWLVACSENQQWRLPLRPIHQIGTGATGRSPQRLLETRRIPWKHKFPIQDGPRRILRRVTGRRPAEPLFVIRRAALPNHALRGGDLQGGTFLER